MKTPHTWPTQVDFTSVQGLKKGGFQGCSTIGNLRANRCMDLPMKPGVYLVVREARTTPGFLKKGTGGHTGGQDPNVTIPILKEAWVLGAIVLNIGKAGGRGTAATLQSRVNQYLKFGEGKRYSHKGGKYIWQIEASNRLKVCWKPTPNEDPRDVEKALIASFEKLYEKLPFANLRR